MRILLVTHYYADHGGGVEVVAHEIASRLVQRGMEVRWVASGPKPAIETPGIVYLPVRACNASERWLGVPYPLWGPSGLLRCFRQVAGCDWVHLHDSLYFGNFLTYLAARVLRRPTLVTQHIGEVPYRQRLLRGLMRLAVHTVSRMVLGGATRVVFISRGVQQYFERFVRCRAEPVFLPNGVDLKLFHPVDDALRRSMRQALGWPDGQPVFLFVGRFVEKKGLSRLRRLAQRFPQVRWVMIGWGRDDPRQWDLPNVTCLGHIEHASLAQYYRAADLLVLPSVGEGFPLVVQEAMACGTPALISAETVPAMPGVETVVYGSELDEASLDRTVQEILDRPDELRQRRQSSAEFACRAWNWETCVASYVELFQGARESR